MKSKIENGSATVEQSRTSGLQAITEIAVDLTALVDRLEGEMREHRLAGPEIADQLHELRLQSERLFAGA